MSDVNTNVEDLARFLHERYEKHAEFVGWKTQEGCQVPFDELPDSNKLVMRAVAQDLIDRNLMFDDALCSQFFVMFLSGKGAFQNKLNGLLIDFLDGHWASRTSPERMKEGFNADRTYDENSIIWFQGEVNRLVEKELSKDTKKLEEAFKRLKK